MVSGRPIHKKEQRSAYGKYCRSTKRSKSHEYRWDKGQMGCEFTLHSVDSRAWRHVNATGEFCSDYILSEDLAIRRPQLMVVIVAGACGIAAGTQLAVLGALGRAARQGAIIKGGILPGDSRPTGYGLLRQNRHAYAGRSHRDRRSSGPRRRRGGADRCRGKRRTGV